MDGWPRVAVAALAVWRVSAWLWYEHAGEGARRWLCQWPWAAGQLSCFWCVTFWVALLLWWLPWWVLLPLALSGAAILLSGGGRILWREMVDNDGE